MVKFGHGLFCLAGGGGGGGGEGEGAVKLTVNKFIYNGTRQEAIVATPAPIDSEQLKKKSLC